MLLCFIHGFKGDANTFGPSSQFAYELRKWVAADLPRVDVRVAVYPPYDTRGDLAAAVAAMVEWLQDRVIDYEVAAGTPSPTVDPSVRCILIGHSMGGIVAADALLSLVDPRGEADSSHPYVESELNGLMFPYVQAVLGFDTPYLGIATGVVAHGAQDRYAATTSALSQLNTLREAVWGKSAEDGSSSAPKAPKALPAPPTASSADNSWGWGKIALLAGAGVLASGTAAVAYWNRSQINQGWSWATSHLQFVGCLARSEDLRRRLARVDRAHRELRIGFGNLYTQLGKTAKAKADAETEKNGGTTSAASAAVSLLSSTRTFCNLPSREAAGDWRPAINDAATDETGAHMNMFTAEDNPNYERLLADANDMIVRWTQDTEWYRTSSRRQRTS